MAKNYKNIIKNLKNYIENNHDYSIENDRFDIDDGQFGKKKCKNISEKEKENVSIKWLQNLDVYLHSLEWEKIYKNPVEIATVLGVFADNMDKFDLTMWISLDKGYFINITSANADSIIRYLYERYPY